jgi:hypothetical protein
MHESTHMTTQSFFSNVSAFATPFLKSGKGGSRDPLLVAKTKFALTATKQIKLISDSAAKGFWFKKQGDGLVLTLKNGSATLNAERPSFAVATAADAIKFLEQAKAAASAGEFDELFKATARKVKSAQTAAIPDSVSPAPQSPSPVAAPKTVQTAPASVNPKRK